MSKPDRPRRVFVSYAWEDGERGSYREWVTRLAAKLRGDGIDIRCDIWDVERGLTGLCRFEAGELDDLAPGLPLADDALLY